MHVMLHTYVPVCRFLEFLMYSFINISAVYCCAAVVYNNSSFDVLLSGMKCITLHQLNWNIIHYCSIYYLDAIHILNSKPIYFHSTWWIGYLLSAICKLFTHKILANIVQFSIPHLASGINNSFTIFLPTHICRILYLQYWI